jgi:2-methylisocitrate lyase-like PEP mutase family enzyme
MAPGLPDLESVGAVCAAVGKPFNFMVGIKGKSFTVAALAVVGMKRISLATSLYRAAMTGLLSAAREVREHGTFGCLARDHLRARRRRNRPWQSPWRYLFNDAVGLQQQ